MVEDELLICTGFHEADMCDNCLASQMACVTFARTSMSTLADPLIPLLLRFYAAHTFRESAEKLWVGLAYDGVFLRCLKGYFIGNCCETTGNRKEHSGKNVRKK